MIRNACNCLNPCNTLFYNTDMDMTKLEGLRFVRKSF